MSFREGGCIQHWNLELWGSVQDSKANLTSSSTPYHLLLCWSYFGWDILWMFVWSSLCLQKKIVWFISTWIRYWQNYPRIGGGGVGVSKRQCRLVYISYRVSNSFDVESEILCAIEGPNWFHVVVIHPRFRRGLLGHWPNRSENIIGNPLKVQSILGN